MLAKPDMFYPKRGAVPLVVEGVCVAATVRDPAGFAVFRFFLSRTSQD